jgi:hypothetical protein
MVPARYRALHRRKLQRRSPDRLYWRHPRRQMSADPKNPAARIAPPPPAPARRPQSRFTASVRRHCASSIRAMARLRPPTRHDSPPEYPAGPSQPRRSPPISDHHPACYSSCSMAMHCGSPAVSRPATLGRQRFGLCPRLPVAEGHPCSGLRATGAQSPRQCPAIRRSPAQPFRPTPEKRLP